MKAHDRIGVRQVIDQFRLVAGPRHDELGDVAQDGRLDRGLVEEVGDQNRETLRHQRLLLLVPAGRDGGHLVLAGECTEPGEDRVGIGHREDSAFSGSARNLERYRPVPDRSQLGEHGMFELDPIALVETQGPGFKIPGRGKEPEPAIGEARDPGRHLHPDRRRAGMLADDRLGGAKWNSHHEGSTGGLSQKFQSGRMMSCTTRIAARVTAPPPGVLARTRGASPRAPAGTPSNGARHANAEARDTLPDRELADQEKEEKRPPVDPASVDLDLLVQRRHPFKWTALAALR